MFSVYLSMDAFFDWRQNMIITRFENSELPVTEIDFPAVTVCSQGLNMDNVAKAVERDFTEWHTERRRREQARRRREAEEELEGEDAAKGDLDDAEDLGGSTPTSSGAAPRRQPARRW